VRTPYLLAALGLALLRAASADAQTSCHRCLGGFRFLPSSVASDPFATTHFENATGGGMALNLDVPVRNLAGDTVNTLTGNIGFLLVDFEYQKSIKNWFALRGSVLGVGRIGTSLEALVASGVSAGFGASIGATVPVWKSDQFLVSAVADLGTNKAYDVDPYGFAKTLADSGYGNGAKTVLLSSSNVGNWSIGARGAWGIKPWMGVNAQLAVGQVNRPAINAESVTGFGAQVGFDFAKTTSNVPVGLSLAYRGLTGPGRTGDITRGYRLFELGVFYTGRPDYQIGADFFLSKIASREGTVPDLDAVQFRLVTHLDF